MTDQELYNDMMRDFDGPTLCGCGSGEPRFALNDVMGIFCAYVCDQCEKEKRSHYKPCTFGSVDAYRQNALDCGEDIEPEDY